MVKRKPNNGCEQGCKRAVSGIHWSFWSMLHHIILWRQWHMLHTSTISHKVTITV